MFVVLEDLEVGNGLQVCQHVVGCDPCVVQFGSEKCENLGHYTDCYAEKKAGFDRSTTKMLADLEFGFSKHQNPRPPPPVLRVNRFFSVELSWEDIYDSVVTLAQENEVANKAEWRAVLRSRASDELDVELTNFKVHAQDIFQS